MRVWSLSLCHLLLASFALADVTQPTFTVHDYLALSYVQGPRFSPDGTRIAYESGARSSWDGGTDYSIFVTLADGSPTMKLTPTDTQDWSPRWSPDGSRIAFKSTRSGSVQVHVVSASGGGVQQVTSESGGISSFEWAGASSIAFSAKKPRDAELVSREKASGGGYVVGTRSRRSALWIQSVTGNAPKTKIAIGDYYIGGLDVSPDAERLALIVAPSSDLYERITASEILVVDMRGKELYRSEVSGSFMHLAFSPDGSRVSYVGSTVGFAANDGLFVTNLRTNSTVNLTREFDPTIRGVEWVDNRSLAFVTPRHVHSGIYRVSLDGEIDTILEPDRVINSFSVNAADELLVFAATTSTSPVELYSSRFGDNGSGAKQLTSTHHKQQTSVQASTRVVRYPSFDGVEIEAVVTLPPGFDRDSSYPLLVNPHGGPDVIVMDGFNPAAQIFAHQGYIVFQPNFRGSIGYGRDFYAANRGRMGDIDYRDIMSGVDHLLSRFPVNSDEMVVGGESYGGTLALWIIGRTNRFKAAVCLSGTANAISRYGQSDINHGAIAEWEFKTVPAKDWEGFWRMSPLPHLVSAKTPILIVHAEEDHRVPVGQAWEAYRTLNDAGAQVEMVLYPDIGHSFGSPDVYADVYRRWLDWYSKYLESE